VKLKSEETINTKTETVEGQIFRYKVIFDKNLIITETRRWGVLRFCPFYCFPFV